MIAVPHHTAWKLCAKLRRAMVKHRGREAGRVCRGRERKGRTASRARGAGDQNARFCRSVAQFTGHGRRRAYLSLNRPGYAPADLLKLYIYGYPNRVRSSRRLEAETQPQYRGDLAAATPEAGLQDHR